MGESMRVPILVSASALFIFGALLEAGAAEKQYGPGVTDTEIKIGPTVPYSGPACRGAPAGIASAGNQPENANGDLR
jgi:hypothetical protein